MPIRNSNIIQCTIEMMEQMLTTDNVYDILSHCLDLTGSMVECDASIAWIIDNENNRLYPLFHKGPSDITGVSLPIGNDIMGQAVSSGEVIIIDDVSKEPDFEGTVFDSSGFSARSVMYLPITILGKTYGCFQLISRSVGLFTKDNVTICKRLAGVAALAVSEQGLEFEPIKHGNVIISLRNIIKEYSTSGAAVRILNNIDLDIYENEFIVILGESGCGKSTLLNIIGGMDKLTEGQLTVEGKDYSYPTEKDLTGYRRNQIGFIFQSYNLMPNLTAKENLDFIADLVPEPMDTDTALEKVGMLAKADNYPSQLSGGQQQRIAIARALIKRPRVTLADEPTAALDLTTGLEVLDTLEHIVRENTATLIMVTHNNEIAKMADRVIRLRSGRIESIKINPAPAHAKELTW